MSSNESAAYEIMRSLNVDYVLVIFGGVIGYSGDDINKFLWMVRIAEGEHPKDIKVPLWFYKVTIQMNASRQICLVQIFRNIAHIYTGWVKGKRCVFRKLSFDEKQVSRAQKNQVAW